MLFARPFVVSPDKLSFVLDRVIQHRPWFDDFVWDAGDDVKRMAASQYIARATSNGRVLEVWRDDALVGILLIEVVAARTDACCHFIFFDQKLADKRAICASAMQWAFDRLDVHRLSTEVPTFAAILAKFAKRKLGFRYEAEGLGLDDSDAERASRKREAMRYKGRWEDVLLLSITREEFLERSKDGATAERGTVADATEHRPAASVLAQSEPDGRRADADQRPQ